MLRNNIRQMRIRVSELSVFFSDVKKIDLSRRFCVVFSSFGASSLLFYTPDSFKNSYLLPLDYCVEEG